MYLFLSTLKFENLKIMKLIMNKKKSESKIWK